MDSSGCSAGRAGAKQIYAVEGGEVGQSYAKLVLRFFFTKAIPSSMFVAGNDGRCVMGHVLMSQRISTTTFSRTVLVLAASPGKKQAGFPCPVRAWMKCMEVL